MKVHIDSYQFGRIVINGVEYRSDLTIAGGVVKPDWWRRQGHLLSPEDVEPLVSSGCSILLIGCGAYGAMSIAEAAREFLREQNIELHTADTHSAIQKFNELSDAGMNVAAALHLTC